MSLHWEFIFYTILPNQHSQISTSKEIKFNEHIKIVMI